VGEGCEAGSQVMSLRRLYFAGRTEGGFRNWKFEPSDRVNESVYTVTQRPSSTISSDDMPRPQKKLF